MIIGKCPVCGEDMRIGSDMTNADRIRSMTDEELLEFLYWEADGSGKTPEQWISWLKQEVKQ